MGLRASSTIRCSFAMPASASDSAVCS